MGIFFNGNIFSMVTFLQWQHFFNGQFFAMVNFLQRSNFCMSYFCKGQIFAMVTFASPSSSPVPQNRLVDRDPEAGRGPPTPRRSVS